MALRSFCLLLVVCGVAAADPVQFSFVFPEVSGSTGTGFDDPVDGAQRRAAAMAAGAIWSNHLTASYAGETIVVSMTFDGSLPAGALAGTDQLRYSGFGPFSAGMATSAGFSATVADHSFNFMDTTVTPDITVRVNPSPSVGPWYYGTDGLGGGGQLDFLTNTLHEITHGLGFDSAYDETGHSVYTDTSGALVQGNHYDTWVQIGTADAFENTMAGTTNWFYSKLLTPAERAAAMGGGALYWFGPNARAANGGNLVKLDATVLVRMGSDVVHTDRFAFPNGLMRPTLPLGFVQHTPDAITLGMLADLGWTVSTVPEPGSVAMLALGVAVFLVVRRRRITAAGGGRLPAK